MRIDSSTPAVDPATFSFPKDTVRIQAENRHIIQAVRAVNASEKLGVGNELRFSLDRRTRKPVIKIVNSSTNEVVQQIPNEQILRLADELKLFG